MNNRNLRNGTGEKLAQFERFLEIYGSEEGRWPPQGQRLLRECGEAGRKALAEAKALDALLSLAPAGNVTRGLEERILTAVRRDVRAGEEIESAGRFGKPQQARIRQMGRGVHWRLFQAESVAARLQLWTGVRTGAVLAASLLIGVYLGMSGAAAPVMQGVVAFLAEDGSVTGGMTLLGTGIAEGGAL